MLILLMYKTHYQKLLYAMSMILGIILLSLNCKEKVWSTFCRQKTTKTKKTKTKTKTKVVLQPTTYPKFWPHLSHHSSRFPFPPILSLLLSSRQIYTVPTPSPSFHRHHTPSQHVIAHTATTLLTRLTIFVVSL